MSILFGTWQRLRNFAANIDKLQCAQNSLSHVVLSGRHREHLSAWLCVFGGRGRGRGLCVFSGLCVDM